MNVLVCDDHRLFGEALAVVLRGSGHTATCALNPRKALDLLASPAAERVDVCVMDLDFPDGCGVEATGDLLEVSPSTRVVIVTGSSDPARLAQALDAGASGMALKDDDIAHLVDTIERVHRGDVVFRADALERSIKGQAARAGGQDGLFRFLTVREREVLDRLVAGESTADLARAMGVRYSTARTHIQNILMKLGVHSKLEAVAFAVRNRVVAVPFGDSRVRRSA